MMDPKTVHVNLFLNNWTSTCFATIDMDGQWIKRLGEVQKLFSDHSQVQKQQDEIISKKIHHEDYSTKDPDFVRLSSKAMLKDRAELGGRNRNATVAYLCEQPKFKITLDFLELIAKFSPSAHEFDKEGADEGCVWLGPYSTITTGLQFGRPEVMKLAILMTPKWLKNKSVEARGVSFAFAKCHTIPDIIKFVMEVNPSVFSSNELLLAPFLWVPEFFPLVLAYQPQWTYQQFVDDATWSNIEEHTHLKNLTECLMPKVTHKQKVANVGKEWMLNDELQGLKLPSSWCNGAV